MPDTTPNYGFQKPLGTDIAPPYAAVAQNAEITEQELINLDGRVTLAESEAETLRAELDTANVNIGDAQQTADTALDLATYTHNRLAASVPYLQAVHDLSPTEGAWVPPTGYARYELGGIITDWIADAQAAGYTVDAGVLRNYGNSKRRTRSAVDKSTRGTYHRSTRTPINDECGYGPITSSAWAECPWDERFFRGIRPNGAESGYVPQSYLLIGDALTLDVHTDFAYPMLAYVGESFLSAEEYSKSIATFGESKRLRKKRTTISGEIHARPAVFEIVLRGTKAGQPTIYGRGTKISVHGEFVWKDGQFDLSVVKPIINIYD